MDDVLAFLPIKTMNFMCKCERLLGALVLFNKLRFLLKCLINISLPATQITYVHTHYCLTHIKLCIYTKRFQFTFIHILFNVLLHCWAVFNYTVCSFFCLQWNKSSLYFGLSYMYYMLLVIYECYLWLVPKNKLKTKTRKVD
jgi:hypothetical protein